MDPFIAYACAYRDIATQLARLGIIREWSEAGVSPEVAARFANKGYLPSEGLPLLAAIGTLEPTEGHWAAWQAEDDKPGAWFDPRPSHGFADSQYARRTWLDDWREQHPNG